MTTMPCMFVVIAIDGPSGAGKSTVARQLAQTLGYRYVDSGAMYRAVGWVAWTSGRSWDDSEALAELLAQTPIELRFEDGRSSILVHGQDVTRALRGETVGRAASAVARQPAVRRVITAKLRGLRSPGGLVMEGRDIGTVVFPEANLKFFLDASPEVRAQRRYQEMRQTGQDMTMQEVRQAIAVRDAQDSRRAVAPLTRAADAILIDTTDLTVDEIVRIMLSGIHRNILPG